MSNGTGTCPVCGTTLAERKPGPGRNRIYCGAKCRTKAAVTRRPPKKEPYRLTETHQCETCGAQYRPRRASQRYCSPACSQASRRTAELVSKTCEACGVTFETKAHERIYCSRECDRLVKIMKAQQGCSVEGCTKKHRARGLCVTHYNDLEDYDRRKPQPIPCVVCGTVTMKPPAFTSRRQVCSNECRYILQWGCTKDERRARAEADRKRHMQLVGPITVAKPTEAPTTVVASPVKHFVSTRCKDCGAWFVDYSLGRSRRPSVTCSETCARRWNRRGRKRRGRKFWIPTHVREAIYERDGWTCQLCKTEVNGTYDPNDMWSASLDHIVPQAHGGTDDPTNLRLVHRYCNAIRSDAQLPDAWFISPSA